MKIEESPTYPFRLTEPLEKPSTECNPERSFFAATAAILCIMVMLLILFLIPSWVVYLGISLFVLYTGWKMYEWLDKTTKTIWK